MKFARLDADQSVFFARELEHIKNATYDKKYPRIKTRQLIPVSFEAGTGADSITYYQYDMAGIAKIVANYAKDIPKASVKGKKFTAPVESLAAGYDYSIQDIRAAAKAGRPLEQRRADAAKKAIMEKEQRIAYFGDAGTGLSGMFNHPNIPTVSLPADGTGSSTKWADKILDPEKVVRDFHSIGTAALKNTKGAMASDTFLMDLDNHVLLDTTARSDNSDMTVLEYAMDKSPTIEQVDWVVQLSQEDSYGNLSTDMAMAYHRDPESVTLEIPQDFEQFPPQPEGLAFEVACHERIGGVIFYYPLSAAICTEI